MSTVTVPCPRCGEVEEGDVVVQVEYDPGCHDYPAGYSASADGTCSLGCELSRAEMDIAEDDAIGMAQEVARGE